MSQLGRRSRPCLDVLSLQAKIRAMSQVPDYEIRVQTIAGPPVSYAWEVYEFGDDLVPKDRSEVTFFTWEAAIAAGQDFLRQKMAEASQGKR